MVQIKMIEDSEESREHTMAVRLASQCSGALLESHLTSFANSNCSCFMLDLNPTLSSASIASSLTSSYASCSSSKA
jgi:hypothetical protein